MSTIVATWMMLESTSTKAKGIAGCEYRDIGAKLSGTSEIIAVDQKHIKGTAHITDAAARTTMMTDGALTANGWDQASQM